MTKILKINYPWSHLKPGQGFFIPCLDTAKVREEGLKAAVTARVFSAKGHIGVVNGQLGVLFVRSFR
jgi:hypothetical protein